MPNYVFLENDVCLAHLVEFVQDNSNKNKIRLKLEMGRYSQNDYALWFPTSKKNTRLYIHPTTLQSHIISRL